MNTTCNTCGRPHSAPLQRLVAGVILEQCVAKCHDAAPSNSYEFLRDAKRRFRDSGVTRGEG